MTVKLSPDSSERDGAAGSAGGALVARLRSVGRALASHRESRRAYLQLMAMSDHELKDIGTTRAAIRAAVLAPSRDAPQNAAAASGASAPPAAPRIAHGRLPHDAHPLPANQNKLEQRSA